MTTPTYFAGITEGRQLLNLWKRDGANIATLAPEHLANLKAFRNRLGGLAYSAFGRALIDGEIDFWEHQITKL